MKKLTLLLAFTAFSFNLFANDTIRFTWTVGSTRIQEFSIQATNGQPFTVDWKSDGTEVESFTGEYCGAYLYHTYDKADDYTVTIAATTAQCRFTGLYYSLYYDNQLTALDVSNSTKLTELDCNNNQLTNLDVSKNTELILLSCYNNQLANLDVSKNTKLTELSCSDNQLTALDVSKNTKLTELNCSSFPLFLNS